MSAARGLRSVMGAAVDDSEHAHLDGPAVRNAKRVGDPKPRETGLQQCPHDMDK